MRNITFDLTKPFMLECEPYTKSIFLSFIAPSLA